MTVADVPVLSTPLVEMTAADKVMGGEPIGRSISATLSSRTGRWLVYALVFFWTVPTFGLFVSSFRPELAVKTTGWWSMFLHPSVTLENYRTVLSSAPGNENLAHFFLNSLKITIPATLLSVGIALLAAYAFSWMKFKGRDWLFVAVVALLMV
ncbi:MAG: carbohydrate ABC transporter permease, partial [Ilumatobacteraceae bacterium]